VRNIKSKTNNNILPLNQNHQSNIHNVNNHPIQDSTKKKVNITSSGILDGSKMTQESQRLHCNSSTKLPSVSNKISLKKEMEKEKIQKA